MKIKSYFAAFVALALLFGCGGEDLSTTQPGSGGTSGSGDSRQDGSAGDDGGLPDSGASDSAPDALADASANQQKWSAYCATCSIGACQSAIDCYEGWFTTEVVTAYVDCRQTSCSTSDDSCAASAQASIAVTAAGTELNNSCLAKIAACSGAFSFPCDAGFFSSVLPTIQTVYETCLAGACADVKDCLMSARPAACNG